MIATLWQREGERERDNDNMIWKMNELNASAGLVGASNLIWRVARLAAAGSGGIDNRALASRCCASGHPLIPPPPAGAIRQRRRQRQVTPLPRPARRSCSP